MGCWAHLSSEMTLYAAVSGGSSGEGRAVVMTIRVMSAGPGYRYPLKSVAAGDGNRDLGTPLIRYYSESGTPPGTWLGSGLPGLGDGVQVGIAAGDPVSEEQLARLLGAGMDPATGGQLGGAYSTRREQAGQARVISSDAARPLSRGPVAGFDLTFSPPKSLSTLWGIADAQAQWLLAEAHHAAVRDALTLLEDRVAATRVGRGGIARLGVRGVVAVAFDHFDSRSGDPQLHTHLVVSNRVQGVDGKWRTLDSRTLHRATVALSATYNGYLVDHTARLLGVGWLPVDRGRDRNPGWEIDGVPANLVAEFSRRTHGTGGVDGITGVKDRLIAEYTHQHGRVPSARVVAKLRQQATLATRPEKEHWSLAELTADWRHRATAVLGEDATTWARGVLSRPPHVRVLDTLPPERVQEIADRVLLEVGDRRATWGRWNLHAEAARQLMGFRFATTGDRSAALDQIVELAEVGSVRLTPDYDRVVPASYVEADGSTRFQPADRILYTSRPILDAETRLLEFAADISGPRLPDRLVRRHTSRGIRGVRLAADQAAAVTQIACSGRVLDLLVGPAGTGKTTALRALHRAWTAANGFGSVIGLAPSATAAEVLGQELGIRAENTAKFLHDHTHGQWNLKPRQLVLIDEASLAGTLTLDRITRHAAAVGAKVVLIGDWAQLSAVETGGAFGMLTRTRPDTPELTDVRRFRAEWEKTASLGLRHGDPTVLDSYQHHDRIHHGDTDVMVDAAYTAWHADRAAGIASVMIAATIETVAELNQRARTDLTAAGIVESGGVVLHDGSTAGVGDVIVTRRNDRGLTSRGGAWVKNGDRWTITARSADGSVTVRRLTRDDRASGGRVVLPAGYVAEEVELGYATTIHRVQGATVERAHAIIDPTTATRELLYVAATRGRDTNRLYLSSDPDNTGEAHHDRPDPAIATDLLTTVLNRPGAEHSATETLRLAVDRHASLTTLIDEYETIAADAQANRWVKVISVALIGGNLLDEVFTSAQYPVLESALRRAESNGHDPAVFLARIAPELTADEISDPATRLARRIDQTAARTRRRSVPLAARRIAGLIPAAIGAMPEDMRAALPQRHRLIEQAAQRLTRTDLNERAAWTQQLGTPGPDAHQQAEWFRQAVTVRLYRERHDITGPVPLGSPRDIRGPAQADEYRAAHTALDRARQLSRQRDYRLPGMDRRLDQGRRIDL